VQDLLSRARRRAELLVHFSSDLGYEVVDWNPFAASLFDLETPQAGLPPMEWSQLPPVLAQYLSDALQRVSGAPEEAMPEFRLPYSSEQVYFAKVFYANIPAEGDKEQEHWYLFCFQDSVNWFDSSQRAVDQKKLETIGELASGVAHDFNNLIMGIQSNAEAMLAHSGMAGQARDNLVNIIRACSTGASLTRSLLGYAKRQPLSMTPFNLIDLIHDVTRIACVTGGNHTISISKEFMDKSSPIAVVGSYSSLSHCVLNLIKNARESMPGGGTVHVSWEGTETMASITVRDHGTGIAEQDLVHIFEPFFSTKKQGTGLGLAMVRGILNQHSGTVEIRSTVGMGTAVSLVWPRGEGIAVEPAPKEATDVRRSTHRIFRRSQRLILQSQRMPAEAHFLIYVIDDDDLVRDGLCSLLQHLGHRVEAFRNAETALHALLEAEACPEVVIVDYNMPGMNGTQFIGRYSAASAGPGRYLKTQILLMSGMPPSHFQDFLSEFAHLRIGLLEKPFSLETLRKKLINIQGNRKLSGNLPRLVAKVVPPPEDGTPQTVGRMEEGSA